MSALSLALLLAAAEPSASPVSTPSATPEPAAMQAAERMLDAIDYDRLMTRMVDAMIVDQRKAVLDKIEEAAGETISEGLKSDIGNAMESSIRRMFRDSSGNMRRGSALIYARHFTAAEIDRLADINNDPVMRKSLAVMPQIVNEMMALTEAMVAAELPKLEREIEAIVTRHSDLPDEPS